MKNVKIEQIFISILLHFEWFTKSIDSNQFLKVFFLKTFVIIFVQECYSYEINVENLNWLLFNVAASWLEIWNEIVRIQYNHYFSNWLLFLKRLWFSFISWILLFNHLKLFATTLDTNVCRIRRKKFVVIMFFVHCSLFVKTFIMRYEFDRKWSNHSNVVSFFSELFQLQFYSLYWQFSLSKCRRYDEFWMISY